VGLVSKVLLAPFTPVSGVIWLAEQLEQQALAVYNSPETIRAELDDIAAAYERGDIDEPERDRLEDAVLARRLEGSDG
jgi:hypothetical protein